MRVVMSAPATSASAERAFSMTGRRSACARSIEHARGRLSALVVEHITVKRHYLLLKNKSKWLLEAFVAKMLGDAADDDALLFE